MIVLLSADGAVVQDSDDCTRLHLQTDLDPAGVRAGLASTGTGEAIDDDTAWLDVATLRSRASLTATADDWDGRWSAMLGYAEKKGWLSDDGRSVQVHVERG